MPGATYIACRADATPACPGDIAFLGSAQHFEMSQDGEFSRLVPALERTKTAAAFYDYHGARARGPVRMGTCSCSCTYGNSAPQGCC